MSMSDDRQLLLFPTPPLLGHISGMTSRSYTHVTAEKRGRDARNMAGCVLSVSVDH